MKNKDIFEAIDKIDAEFVNDAGKYLGGYNDADPVEVRPASKKTSVIKIVAPIAAAIAVVCGVAAVAGTQRPFKYSPGAEGVGMTDGEDTSSDIVDGDEASDTSDTENGDASSDSGDVDETSTPTENNTEEPDHVNEEWNKYKLSEHQLPIGPDGIQLTDNDDYGGFLSIDPPPTGIVKHGVERIGFTFAYIAEPTGANYNSADNPEAFEDGFTFDVSPEVRRIFGQIYDENPGNDTFGDFDAFTAQSSFSWASEDSDELVYDGSSLHFKGTTFLEDVYLVRDDDGYYYIIARNGETHWPSVNIKQQDDGSYKLIPYSGNISGFEYLTETPPITVGIAENQKDILDKLFAENNYCKARVLISDIILLGEDTYAHSPAVISLQLGGYEPKEVAAFINSQTSSAELKTALMEKFGFTDVEVVFNFSDIGIYVTQDTPVDPEDAPRWGEDELVQGMAVKVYDENGLCGIYTYGDH